MGFIGVIYRKMGKGLLKGAEMIQTAAPPKTFSSMGDASKRREPGAAHCMDYRQLNRLGSILARCLRCSEPLSLADGVG